PHRTWLYLSQHLRLRRDAHRARTHSITDPDTDTASNITPGSLACLWRSGMTYQTARVRKLDERRRAAHAPRLPRSRRQRGQSLIIFALALTVLLGLAGLAVDATRAYDLYARMQRAAEAGALAGDLYMPTFYSTPRSVADPNSAISRASQE